MFFNLAGSESGIGVGALINVIVLPSRTNLGLKKGKASFLLYKALIRLTFLATFSGWNPKITISGSNLYAVFSQHKYA